jgi:hypothetical protein
LAGAKNRSFFYGLVTLGPLTIGAERPPAV